MPPSPSYIPLYATTTTTNNNNNKHITTILKILKQYQCQNAKCLSPSWDYMLCPLSKNFLDYSMIYLQSDIQPLSWSHLSTTIKTFNLYLKKSIISDLIGRARLHRETSTGKAKDGLVFLPPINDHNLNHGDDDDYNDDNDDCLIFFPPWNNQTSNNILIHI